ncbi:MAG: molybdopterin-dependent oxidoreductase [Burkholderiales bacterium]|nr:molybdopterin-dependent oxidoreductase [Burkholderiales bacterium]
MEVTHTTCRLCLVRCGMRVESEGGQVRRVLGDRSHPLSKGYLCIKGKASLDLTNSPNRVIYPRKRAGERGSGKWQRVSWDEALEDIAARLNAIIERDGASAVAVQALPPKEYFAYDLLCDAIGSPTFFKHDSHQCFTPQLMSDVLTFGNLLTYPGFTEVNDAEALLLWGVNLSETNGSKHQRVQDAQKKGARVIAVDPRPTLAAREADLWLRVRPGTDAALALAMIHVIIERGWYDREFVAQWTLGFDALAERAARYAPERVAAICWVDANDIRRAAEMFATAKSSAMYTFIGATMGGNSISTLRLMGFLPALTGRIDRKGNNRFLLPTAVRMPSYYGASTGSGLSKNLERQLSAERFPLLAGPNAITAAYPHPRQVIDAMLTGKPYPVRALWTDCNPVVGLEDTWTTLQALKSLDLLIVSELFESPTAHIADYILPVTTHLESDAISEYSGINMIAARVRVMPPRGEAREEADVVLEVLRRMGYGDKLPVSSYRELLDYRLQPLGIDFEEFARRRVVVREDEPLKYLSGKLRRDGKPGFNTPSGKIEFASSTLAKHGHDPLPDFVEPPLSPYRTPEIARDYPLVLVSGTRSIEFYSTLGIEVPRLRRRRPWPVLEMSPETARAHGVAEGDWVSVEAPTTERSIRRQVAIVEGMHPQVVNAEGLWYMPGEDPVEGVLSAGANVLTPLRDDVDPIVGGSVARCILCRVRRIEAAAKVA